LRSSDVKEAEMVREVEEKSDVLIKPRKESTQVQRKRPRKINIKRSIEDLFNRSSA
jgi:hypothetical protein